MVTTLTPGGNVCLLQRLENLGTSQLITALKNPGEDFVASDKCRIVEFEFRVTVSALGNEAWPEKGKHPSHI
jgi:hypothetical protein